MRTKKYWQEQAELRYEEKRELETKLGIKEKALKFLLGASNPYRVEVTQDCNIFCNYGAYVEFEYVDENGVYHSTKRQMLHDKLHLISTSKEAAVFRYDATHPSTYWVLQKAAETFAEIPASLICHQGEKICEIKGDITDVQNDA